jgi:transposase-like protein
MTVAITRQELGAVELRREAGRCRDAKAARRMLALALVLEGGSRAEAARAAGMDRQTLRDWVHRYNAVYGRSPLCKGFLGEARHARCELLTCIRPSVGRTAAGLDG